MSAMTPEQNSTATVTIVATEETRVLGVIDGSEESIPLAVPVEISVAVGQRLTVQLRRPKMPLISATQES